MVLSQSFNGPFTVLSRSFHCPFTILSWSFPVPLTVISQSLHGLFTANVEVLFLFLCPVLLKENLYLGDPPCPEVGPGASMPFIYILSIYRDSSNRTVFGSRRNLFCLKICFLRFLLEKSSKFVHRTVFQFEKNRPN